MENFTAHKVLINRMSWFADRVVVLTLVDPNGRYLDPWTPRAQIVLALPSGLMQRYPLIGDIGDLSSYRIAVLREPTGNGGSEEIHTLGLVGREVEVRSPINHFGLMSAYDYLNLAGDIDIIPILSMTMEAERNVSSWQLICSEQYLITVAFAASLSVLPSGEVMPAPQDASGHPDFDSVIRDVPDDSLICCIGTEEMLAAVGKFCDCLDKADRLHFEGFTAFKLSGSVNSLSLRENLGFADELKRTGFVLKVLTVRTLLEVIREMVPEVLSSSEKWHCSTSETNVIEERPDRRDTIPTFDEDGENSVMMICVDGLRLFCSF